MAEEDRPTAKSGITLVLGGGGARGLSHAGVLRRLEEGGIPIRAVVGTSIGAEIGAFYCAGLSTEEIEELARGLDWMATLKLFWPSLDGGGGITSGRNIEAYLREQLGNKAFTDCHPPLRAIATDMRTGDEVVLDRGELVPAVRASIALPGIIAPFWVEGRLLGDGGMVNPLPVDVARETFGGPVVAVAVHPGALGAGERDGEEAPFQGPQEEDQGPALLESLRRAIQITQAQLVRWHLQASPPDLMLTPVVPGMGTLEFYRGEEALEAGHRTTEAYLPHLRRMAG